MNRRRLLSALAVLLPIGIATKVYTGPGEVWVRTNVGGVVYVVFWSLLVLFLWPRLSPWVAGAVVVAMTAALEFLQLWHPPLLETIRATSFGHALIGSTFAWSDFPHYLAGMLLAVGVASAYGRGRSQ